MRPRNREFSDALSTLWAHDKNAEAYCEREAEARQQLEKERWPNGIVLCPFNRHHSAQRVKPLERKSMGEGWYYCRLCRRKFTVRVNTILHRSHIPLHKWLIARELYRYTRREKTKTPTALDLAAAMMITFRAAQFVEKRMLAASNSDRDFFAAKRYKLPDERRATHNPPAL